MSKYFTIGYVCEHFSISRSRFYAIQSEGFFKPIYIGKSPRFTLKQIREYETALEEASQEQEAAK